MSKKFIDLDKLSRLSKSLDDRSKAAVKAEEQRALAAEQALQTAINGKAASGHKHDDRYYTESEINTKVTNLQAEIDADVKVEADRAKAVEADLQAAIDGKSASGHTHDERYYTETEINTKLAGKSDVGHDHDDDYYTETEIDSKVSTLNTAIATAKSDAQKYADNKITALVDSAPDAMNTLNELAKAINDHQDEYEAYVQTVSSNITTAKSEAIASAESKDAALKTTLQAEIDADVKVEADRAKAAENTLQANIDKKADKSHGNHVPTTQTANNAVFLRNDNSWATVTPSNIGAYSKSDIDTKVTALQTSINGKAPSSHGTHLDLGETSSTAYRGDRGKVAYDHSQVAHAPSNAQKNSDITKAEIEARLTGTISSHSHAPQTTITGNAGSATKWQTPRTFTIGNKGQSVDGTSDVTWTLAEIGAAAKGHTHSSVTTAGELYLNTKMDYGWSGLNYFNINGTAGNAAKVNDTPTTAWWHIIRCNHANETGYYTDIAVPFNETSMYYKRIAGGFVQNDGWVKMLDALNFNDYAAAKDHGTHVTYATATPKAHGTAAVGTSSKVAREDHVHPLQTSVSGNAGTATKLATARTINGTSFDGSGNITTANWGSSRNISISDSDGTNTGTAVSVNGAANATLKLPATIKASLSGNAATATSAGKWTTARTLTIGNKGQSVNGSGNVSWSLADIGAVETVAWDTSIKCATWSRLFQYSAANAVTGGAFLVNIQATRGNVVYGPTILVNFGHSSTCNIVQINNISYSDIKIRGVVDDNGAGYLEIYDNANGATNSTTQGVTVSVTKLTKGLSITKYTAFTNGTTIPTGYASKGEITTVSGCYYTGKAATSGNADTAAKAGKWSTARTLTIGNTGKTVDGSGNVSWSLTEIGAAASSHSHDTLSIKGTDTITSTADDTTAKWGAQGTSIHWYTKTGQLTDQPGQWGYLLNVGRDSEVHQLWMTQASGDLKHRGGNSDGWSGTWRTILDTSNYTTYVTPDNIGAAASSHGTHVTYATATPKANGTAAIGSVNRVAREDHVHPLQTSVSGNAGTATKLATARNIKIGNKGYTFDGSADIAFTLAEIGAEPIAKTVVSKNKSGTTLTLSTDRYQKASLASGDTIVLPSVSAYTEIELFVKDCSLTNINLPDKCKWRVDHNLSAGTSFIIRFVYTTQEWLGEIKIFS